MFILDIPPVYEKKWKNIVADRLQTEIWHMRFACWIPTDTHSEYVLLTAFPPQQWLHERCSGLRYTHIGCLVPVVGHRSAGRRCVDRGCEAPVCGAADQRYVRGGSMGADCSWLPGGRRDCSWLHRGAAGQSVLHPDGKAA